VPVVIVSGFRGGVGSTTIVSNLASALQRADCQTLSIDLHPDNQLCVHYGVDQEIPTGWAQAIVDGDDWKRCAFQSADGRRILPFGELSHFQFAQFREALPVSIAAMAKILAPQPDEWLLVDMPVDRHRALEENTITRLYKEIYALADITLYVINPELGCYRLLKQAALNGESLSDKQLYVINGVNTNSSLSMDIELLLRAEFSPQMLPVSIHQDTALPEAAAFMAAVSEYMPDSKSASDFHSLALWLLGRFGKGGAGE
jgi:cellulose synthase operon protein YhjQ